MSKTDVNDNSNKTIRIENKQPDTNTKYVKLIESTDTPEYYSRTGVLFYSSLVVLSVFVFILSVAMMLSGVKESLLNVNIKVEYVFYLTFLSSVVLPFMFRDSLYLLFELTVNKKSKINDCLMIYNRILKRENNDFVLYQLTAKCIYPECNGNIELKTPSLHKKLYAECNVSENHVYTIDENGVAYPVDQV